MSPTSIPSTVPSHYYIVNCYWNTNYDHPSPDSKVHGANMGPTWGRQDPGVPHVGPMNFAIWEFACPIWGIFYELRVWSTYYPNIAILYGILCHIGSFGSYWIICTPGVLINSFIRIITRSKATYCDLPIKYLLSTKTVFTCRGWLY